MNGANDAEQRRPRRGFALMAALWLMVAIAALSLEISTTSRNQRLAAANALEHARARAAAESGIEHARAILARILQDGDGRRAWRDPIALLDPWSDLTTVKLDSIPVGAGEWYRVSLTHLGAQLNVNRASEGQLRRFLAAHRVDAMVADRLAQRILDWRDRDDARRAEGAEREDYLRAGASEVPSNKDFVDVDELRWVAGMTPELFQSLRSELAVVGSGQVNVNSAGRALLLSLPGTSEAAADVIIGAQMRHDRIANFQDLTDRMPLMTREALERAAPALLPLLAFESREVGVVSEGYVEGSPVRATGTAVIARGGRLTFVAWRAVE